ncbi:polygalacturonase isoform X2 [Salvia miltiorrhiza]|uniref:polygalacturonase isoform X2 n=1 Tax=Salvia miltiorrhiza TaxID=226208 RepID=UPI0025AC250D|nr:polygalacturonase isoform X2 [Salvia miltiorrhiza]
MPKQILMMMHSTNSTTPGTLTSSSALMIVDIILKLLSLAATSQTVFDITKYGATRGADISEALMKAWKDAIASATASQILIPAGDWTLSQAHLAGPNKSPINLEVKGTLKAYPDPAKLPVKTYEWVTINYVNFLTISGGGVFDGQGQQAWKANDCHKNSKCAKLPINLSLNFINNSLIQDVTTKDSKNFHVNCISSANVTFQRFTVSAPGDSVNTDGIHIARSSNVRVLDSVIETGDDCISMGDELTDVLIRGVKCGPGHGISIGSLGKNVQEKDVKGITVQGCTFTNTDNGIRIKTWPSAPATLTISDLHFTDLTMVNVSNPIIFDQQYCPWNLCSLDKPSEIKISNVEIMNVKGTSATAEVLVFSCSRSKPCDNVKIGAVDLKYIGPTPAPTTTRCENIKPIFSATQNPPVCSGPPAQPQPKPAPVK